MVIRRRQVADGVTSAVVITRGGRELNNFASNDYLGLSQHPQAKIAMAQAADKFGVASGGSPYMCGYSQLHQQLEQELAIATGQEKAIFFSSGYLANLGAVTSLYGYGDFICIDRFIHASLIDATRLSGARFTRYSHLDVVALGKAIRRAGCRRTLVISEGVFSMHGDSPPLAEMVAKCASSGATLMIDDAHGFGSVGASGSVALAGLSGTDVPLITATLGKAVGASGAFVAGSEEMLEKISQRARTLIYSTYPPPPVAATALACLRLCQGQTGDRARATLTNLVQHFRDCAHKYGVPVLPSSSPIQLVPVNGGANHAASLAAKLADGGFLIPAIRAPTVPPGSERLRISLTANHSCELVENMVKSIAAII